MRFIICIFLITVGIVFFSCEEDDMENCAREPEVIGLSMTDSLRQEFSCTIEGEDITLVINSMDELKSALQCGRYPDALEFSDYTLIGGKIRSNTCANLLSEQVIRYCDRIEYQINIEKQICQAITDVYFFSLIPKNNNLPVNFNINYN